ncbi:MAG: ABC transporter ATP-binding protein [Bacteroidetes bacterium]|nr:ABC transporter ATP-binding protein [Bacteroidota bacterium]
MPHNSGGDPILQVSGLAKTYPSAVGQPLDVLKDLDLTVRRGEFLAITGESGTGKSTLLHVLGALDRPDAGSVIMDGKEVFRRDDTALSAFRNQAVGFVFQFHHLLPEFTAEENVMMPALIAGRKPSQVRERARRLLADVGLSARGHHRPGELSGGEKQRVAMARALMNEPALILADEPSGNLDEKTADSLHTELLRLSREQGQTFVVVTHNPEFAAMADRRLVLEQGKLHAPTLA